MLAYLYGSGVRTLVMFNAVLHAIWAFSFARSFFEWGQTKVPLNGFPEQPYVLGLMVVSVIFSIYGYRCNGYRKQLLKVFSLLLGAVIQSILATKYGYEYPPLDPMLIICTMLSLWFLGGAWYIGSVEGLNGRTPTVSNGD